MTISQPKSNEEEISMRVKAAIEKLEKVDADANKEKTRIEADANKEKTQIIQGLAEDLEGKIPTNRISNEIVHQMRGDIDRQERRKFVIDTLGNVVVEPHPSIIKKTDFNDNGNELTQNDSVVTSLNDEITSVNRRKEELTDTKRKVLVSHIPMPFELLRRDMATVFRTTKGVGNIFFRVWVDIGTRLVEIEFCGITQDNTMTSAGKGKLKEADTNFTLGS